jgi:hypothetical protein
MQTIFDIDNSSSKESFICAWNKETINLKL